VKNVIKTTIGLGLALAVQAFAAASVLSGTVTIAGGLKFGTNGAVSGVTRVDNGVTAVGYTTSTPDYCSVSADGSVVTPIDIGTCTIDAVQPAGNGFLQSNTLSASFVIGKGDQVITWGTPASTVTYGSGVFVVLSDQSSTGGSGEPITLTSGSTSVCIVSGSTAYIIDGGTCLINADQAGNSKYNAATTATKTITVNKATQTIAALGSLPTGTFGSTYSVATTASSNLAVSYAVFGTGTVCTVDALSGVVTPSTSGNCTIRATQAGDANRFNAATPVDVTVNIAKANRTVNPINGGPSTYGEVASVSATVSAGTTVFAYAAVTGVGTVCDVDPVTGAVTTITSGICGITATAPADIKYNQAVSAEKLLTINLAPQAITNFIDPVSTPTVGTNFTLTATMGASNQALVWTSLTTSVCDIGGGSGIVVPHIGGICTITVDEPSDGALGTGNYLAAPKLTKSFTVVKTPQTITSAVFSTTTPKFGGANFTLTAASTSTLTETFTSTTLDVCTVTSVGHVATVHAVAGGTCSISISQAGDNVWAAANPVRVKTVTIDKASQTITTIATAATPTYGTSFDISSSLVSSAGLPVVLSSGTSSICDVIGATVYPKDVGSCVIIGNAASDNRYNAAPSVSSSFTIGKANQTITKNTSSTTIVYGATGTVSASTSAGASYALIYTSLTPSLCDVTGVSVSTVAVTNNGCQIAVNQPGDTKFNAAPQQVFTISVTPAPQVITWNTAAGQTKPMGATFTVSATGGAFSGNAVYYTADDAQCSIIGTTVTPIQLGTCVLTAHQDASALYSAAPDVNLSVTIGAAAQTLAAMTTSNATPVFGTNFTVNTIASSGQLPQYTSTTTSVCTVVQATGVVSPVTFGTCTIEADVPAGNGYAAATAKVSKTISISKANQTISAFTVAGSASVGSSDLTATTTASSALTVSYNTSGTIGGVCTVNATTGAVQALLSGSCKVTATQAGDNRYNAATSVDVIIPIGLATQAITNAAASNASPTFGVDYTITATKGVSNVALVFSSQTPLVCSVGSASGVVHPLDKGTCVIAIDEAGTTAYSAAPQVTVSSVIAVGVQTITVSPTTTPATHVYGTPFVVTATGGVQGNLISFAGDNVFCSISNLVSPISGNSWTSSATVTPLKSGACVVTASQAATTGFNAATDVPTTYNIALQPRTITWNGANATTGTFGTDFTISANISGSGPAITFGTGSSACSINAAGTVHPLSVGDCIPTASAIADTKYDAVTASTPPTILISRMARSINLITTSDADDAVVYGDQFTVSASTVLAVANAAAQAPVTYVVTPSNVCTVDGNGLVTTQGAGTCTINAQSDQNDQYAAVALTTLNKTVSVAYQPRTITWNSPADGTHKTFGADFTIDAVVSGNGLPIYFTTSSAACSVSGTTVHPLQAGACVITAKADQGVKYAKAPDQPRTFNIDLMDRAYPTITTSATPTYGTPFQIVASAITGGGTVTFEATGECTVAGDMVTPLNSGACNIVAKSVATAQYSAMTSSPATVFTIGRKVRTVIADPSTVTSPQVYGAPFVVTANAGPGVKATYTVTGTCTGVNGDGTNGAALGEALITPTQYGNCVVTANWAQDLQYFSVNSNAVTFAIQKATRTISAINSGAAVTYTYNIPFTAAVTVTPAATVVYGTTTSSICDVVPATGVVTPKQLGACIITADVAQTNQYNAISATPKTFTVVTVVQTISTAGVVGPATYGIAVNMTVKASPSLYPVSYATKTPDVCSVSGSIVTPLTSGECILTYSQAGDSKYGAATPVDQTFNIAKASQTINPILGGPTVYGTPATVSTQSTSGLAVIFSSADNSLCTVTANAFNSTTKVSTALVTPVSIGAGGVASPCIVRANSAATDSFSVASQVTLSITFAKADQVIDPIVANTGVFKVGTAFGVSATSTGSANPVTFAVVSGPCTSSGANGATITPTALGTCKISANKAATLTQYNAAAQVTEDYVIAKSAQTISAITISSTIPFGTKVPVFASASSNLQVAFGTTTPSVCTVTDSIIDGSFVSSAGVTPLATGICIITANQAGNANQYTAATQVTKQVTVSATTPTIGAITTTEVAPTFGTPFTVTAVTSSGNPATFSTTTPTYCTVVGSTGVVTPVKSGTNACVIKANLAATGGYTSASEVSASFTIAKATQSIVGAVNGVGGITGGPTSFGQSVAAVATASSGIAVTFGSLTPLVCTVSDTANGRIVTAVDQGTCTLTASAVSDDRYLAAPTVVSAPITIGQGVQIVSSFIASNIAPKVGQTFDVSATGGGSGNPLVFTATGEANCTISGTTVTAKHAGSCKITVNQTGNARYSAVNPALASSQLTVTIVKANQVVAAITGGPTALGTTPTVSTTSNAPGATFVFTSETPSVCTITNAVVTTLLTGTCTLKAVGSTTTDYEEGQVLTSTVVGKQLQTLAAITGFPTVYKGTGTLVTSTDAVVAQGAAALAFTFSSLTPTVCTVSGNVATAVDVGVCKVRAIQAGNGTYQPDTVETSSNAIGVATQTVAIPTVTGAASAKYLDTLAITTTSNSGLTAFTYTPADASICDITPAGKLAAKKEGNCVITATQAGSTQWAAATSASVTVAIAKRPQTVISITNGPAKYLDVVTMAATSTSGGTNFTFTSTTTSVCTNVGAVVTVINVGLCTIEATEAGLANYWLPSAVLKQNFTIAKKEQTLSDITGGPSLYGQTATIASTATSTLVPVFTSTTPAVCTVLADKVTAVATGSCIVRANQPGDSKYSAAPVVVDTMVIAPRPLSISADVVTKVYGTPDTLKYTVDNSKNDADTILKGDKLVGALARTAGENVGNYPITQGTLNSASNPKYLITYLPGGSLTIVKKPITITADSVVKVYGTTPATALTYKVTPALKSTEVLVGALARETPILAANDPVMSYGILQGTLTEANNPNYAITYVGRNYKVTRMPLKVTADTVSKIYGAADPAFTLKTIPASLTGLSALTGTLSRKPGDTAGVYAILQGTVDTILNKNYLITFVSNNLTIKPKEITVTAVEKSIVYGDADGLTKTISPALLGTDTLSGAMTRKAGSVVGVYPITIGTLKNPNYKITFVSKNLTITPKPITLVAVDTNKVYGAADPVFKYTKAADALVGKDVLKGILTRDAGTDVDEYAITAGTLNSANNPNYTITFTPGKFDITAKPMTITADSLTKFYGDQIVLTYKTVGRVGTDVINGSLARAGGATPGVGSYAITAGDISNVNNPNYDITFVSKSVVVLPKPLKITADSVSYVYGDANATDNTKLTAKFVGLAYGETITAAGTKGWLSREAGHNATKYAITLGTIADPNYKITFVPNYVTIKPKGLAVVAKASTKVYGVDDNLEYTIPTTTPDSGLVTWTVNNAPVTDTLAGKLSRTVGTGVKKYAITIGTLANPNYKIAFKSDSLEITKKDITVTPDNMTKVYGYPNPVYTYTTAPGALVGKDVLKGLLSRAVGEDVIASPFYEITAGTLTNALNPNYNITVASGKALEITRRPVTVTPAVLSKVYDEVTTTPVLTYTATGLYSTNTLKGTLEREVGENVGTRAILQGTTLVNSENPNYDIKFVTGKTVTITKKALKITMNAATMVVGGQEPAATATIVGLVTAGSGGALTGDYSRAPGSTVGKYAYTLGTVKNTNGNYTITFVPANLTITAAPIAKYAINDAANGNEGQVSEVVASIGTIQGETHIFDINGAQVWSGNVVLGDYRMLETLLNPGRYVVKNRTAGSFVWVKN